jgi:hypothetical protein
MEVFGTWFLQLFGQPRSDRAQEAGNQRIGHHSAAEIGERDSLRDQTASLRNSISIIELVNWHSCGAAFIKQHDRKG